MRTIPTLSQVEHNFFDMVDEMFEKLYARAQDPDDEIVSSSFKWRSFGDTPACLKFNMDEIGSDTNKGRKKKVAGDFLGDTFRSPPALSRDQKEQTDSFS